MARDLAVPALLRWMALLTLWMAALAPGLARAEEKPARPIYALPAKPTQALIRQAIAGGATWDFGGEYSPEYALAPDGTASYSYGDEYREESCLEKEVRFTVGADTIAWSCTVGVFQNAGEDENGMRRSLASKHRDNFRFRVKLVSPEVMVLASPEKSGPITVLTPVARSSGRKGLGGLGQKGQDCFLVELVAGAADTALYEQVKGRLARATDEELVRGAVLLQGPRAREPRATTEIFYESGAGPDVANQIATLLRPLIGPVEPKPWPSAWDYEVVVVVGQTAARPAPK